MYQRIKLTALLLTIFILPGCASHQVTNQDPYESMNRVTFKINEKLDNNLIKPVATAYANAAPDYVRTRVTNFFENVNYLNVILNDFLQGKLDQGLSDVSRVIFNSTIGIGGIFDVSTPLGFPKNDEDVGQTLAVWGLPQGGYLNIPMSGPNTVRNAPNIVATSILNPLNYTTSVVLWPLSIIQIINTRANFLEASNVIDEIAIDPYTFIREAYLQQRQSLIHDGNIPNQALEDIFDSILDEEEEEENNGQLTIE